MHAPAGQGVEVGGQGLAFAGAHLGNVAAMQHRAADELHVELSLAGVPAHGLADRGEGLRQKAIQPFSGVQPLPILGRLAQQLPVRAGAQLGLQRVDALDQRRIAARRPPGIVANQLL